MITDERGLPIAHDPYYSTPTTYDRLSAALMQERDIAQLAEISLSLFSDARNELHRLKKEIKTADKLTVDRIDNEIWNIQDFVMTIAEKRIDKIVGLATSEAVTGEKMDRTGMMEHELIMMNKITDAIKVNLDQAYQTAGVTEK